jgi:hypothetical protein
VTVGLIARPESTTLPITATTTLAELKSDIAARVGVSPMEQLLQLTGPHRGVPDDVDPLAATSDSQYLWELGVRPGMALRVNVMAIPEHGASPLHAPAEAQLGLHPGGAHTARENNCAMAWRSWCFGLLGVSCLAWIAACSIRAVLRGAIHGLVLDYGLFAYVILAHLWLFFMFIGAGGSALRTIWQQTLKESVRLSMAKIYRIRDWWDDPESVQYCVSAAKRRARRARRALSALSAVGMWVLLVGLLGFAAYAVAKCPGGDKYPHAHGLGACRILRGAAESACQCSPGYHGHEYRHCGWTTTAPMPTARWEVGVAAWGGVLYAVGGVKYPRGNGWQQQVATATVEAYDVATARWSALAPMPTARRDLGTTAWGGVVYAAGGSNRGLLYEGLGAQGANNKNFYLTTFEAYDVETGNWSTLAPMPTRRSELDVAACRGVVYAVGGHGWGYTVATVEAYDVAAGSWSTLASMPTARNSLGVAAWGGVVYAVGGCWEGYKYATVEAYDVETGNWSTLGSISVARCGVGMAAWGGILYVLGGIDGGSNYPNAVEAYDVTAAS